MDNLLPSVAESPMDPDTEVVFDVSFEVPVSTVLDFDESWESLLFVPNREYSISLDGLVVVIVAAFCGVAILIVLVPQASSSLQTELFSADPS